MNTTIAQQELTDRIEQRLAKLSLPDEPSLLYDPVRYTLSLGGKRIRPFFVLMACGMCGGDSEEAIPAALAIELLHNFTLLHDDIMDAAETRRGKPSVYKKWDASTAILSGDVMYSRAFEQLQYYGSSDQYSKNQYAAILDIFLKSAETVCEGQAYDLEFARRTQVTIEEYLKMIRGKTAAMISSSFMLGGAVARADERQLNLLKKLGEAVGTAFQIQDDLLDVIADPSKFGKQHGGDILEGKKTYLSILALQRGDEEQKSKLEHIFNAKDVSVQQVNEVVEIYRILKIIEDTENAIDEYYSEAESLLSGFPESGHKSELNTYLNKLKNREF